MSLDASEPKVQEEKDVDGPLHAINVGGKEFTARERVLCKSSLLKVQLTGPFSKGGYVVDRDPELFRKLLNCMRDPSFLEIYDMKELAPEVLFFGVDLPVQEEEGPQIEYDETSAFQPCLGFVSHGVPCKDGVCFVMTHNRPEQPFQTDCGIFIPDGYVGLLDEYGATGRVLLPDRLVNLHLDKTHQKDAVAAVLIFLRTDGGKPKRCTLTKVDKYARPFLPKEFYIHNHGMQYDALSKFLDYPFPKELRSGRGHTVKV